jgi:hypothetical protein
MSLSNIFERLTGDLSKIAQGRQAIELGATPVSKECILSKGQAKHFNIVGPNIVYLFKRIR